MSLYFLDTDTLSLFERAHPAVVNRATSLRPEDILAITVISVEEQLSGWYSMIRQAKRAKTVAHAYQRLADTAKALSDFEIYSFTELAIQQYEHLVRLKLNIGGMDLRIAAVALENNAILVTCNLKDFRRVPNLVIEDWSN